jgi:hypothetical protein
VKIFNSVLGYQVANGELWSEQQVAENAVRHVSVHATGIKARGVCEWRG